MNCGLSLPLFYSKLPVVDQSWQRSTEGHTGSWLGRRRVLEPRDPGVRRQQASVGCCQTETTSVSLIRHHPSLLGLTNSPEDPHGYQQIIIAVQANHSVTSRARQAQCLRQFAGQFHHVPVPKRFRSFRCCPAVIRDCYAVWVHDSSGGYKLLQRPSSHDDNESRAANPQYVGAGTGHLKFNSWTV